MKELKKNLSVSFSKFLLNYDFRATIAGKELLKMPWSSESTPYRAMSAKLGRTRVSRKPKNYLLVKNDEIYIHLDYYEIFIIMTL